MTPFSRRSGVPWPLGAAGAILLLYLVTPFLYTLASLDWTSVVDVIRQPETVRALWTSVLTATVSTCLVTVLGVPLAYLLTRGDFVGKTLLGVLVYLPLVVPPLVGGILLLVLYGPYAPVGGWLGARGIQITDALPGIVLAQAFVAGPYLVVATRIAFEGVDPTLERVSYALGKPPLTTFLHVSLPLAYPGILAGMSLAWLRALGEFGATIMVAYHPYTLPVYLFVQFGSQGLHTALPVAVLLLAAGIGALAVLEAANRRGSGRTVL